MSIQAISYDKLLNLTNTLEEAVLFVENKQKTNDDVDFLIVIQSFVQQMAIGLENHLDMSWFHS
jgi:hypothetical protein